jgi:hypothetical protein
MRGEVNIVIPINDTRPCHAVRDAGKRQSLTFLLPPFMAAVWRVFGQNYFREATLRHSSRAALILLWRGQNRAPTSAETGAKRGFFQDGYDNRAAYRGI